MMRAKKKGIDTCDPDAMLLPVLLLPTLLTHLVTTGALIWMYTAAKAAATAAAADAAAVGRAAYIPGTEGRHHNVWSGCAR